MEAYKKNRHQICLFLFNNNVDLKNNNRNDRKSFWIFWVLEELQWLYFKSILINYEITYDTDMKSSGVGGGGASAPPEVLIYSKSGQHPW